jgi:anthranilate synthase component 1
VSTARISDLCRPAPEDFRKLAAGHRIVPVWRTLVADTLTPVGAFLQVTGDRPGFLFESVEGGERWGRWSFVGRDPLVTFTAFGPGVVSSGEVTLPPQVSAGMDDGLLATLSTLLEEFRAPALDGLPPLHGGLVGYIGYDVVREIERLPDVPRDDLGLADSVLFMIGQLCAFDRWLQRVVLVDNVLVPEGATEVELSAAYESAEARLETLAEDLFRPLREPPFEDPSLVDLVETSATAPGWVGELPESERTMSSASFMDAVEVAKEFIRAGDIFQVVLSQRFDFDLDAEPFDVYRALRLVNPSPYLYFLRTEQCCVVGSSPEPMVRLRDGVVVSRPIAGTRRRGATEIEDERLAGELSEHPKEVAEHVMLVDLARNDVGRVVSFGSEHMDELMTVERYSHVMHLTSQVSGTLAPGNGPVDVLRATFPAGTLSGAPKVRAMQIIDELEPTKRGVYGGVVGYLNFSGDLDTAIAIRTMVVGTDGRAHVQAGAGIVADSDPAQEDAECVNKAAALLAAVPAARRATAARDAARARETSEPAVPTRGGTQDPAERVVEGPGSGPAGSALGAPQPTKS